MTLSDKRKIELAQKACSQLITRAQTLMVSVSANAQTGAQSAPETQDQSAPETGFVPFIRHDGHFIIFTSHLSAHTRLLLSGGSARYMLVEDEANAQNIWARIRLSFEGELVEIQRENAEFDRLCDQLATAHGPVMDVIRSFTDFHLFQITPVSGRLVTGFAAAYAVSGPDFTIQAHLTKS